ncbi:MAG: nucleotidyltransferase domain-containing protein [Clostridiales bacterium]|nr:nucleotidyltransferase domain-containing protein [Clostridiales bacterium]
MNVGLSGDVVAAIRAVLACDGNITAAKVFGSRAKGNYSAVSDVDLALFGGGGLLSAEKIRAELDELPYPFHFDVVFYDDLKNVQLRRHIDRVGKTIYEAETSGGGL